MIMRRGFSVFFSLEVFSRAAVVQESQEESLAIEEDNSEDQLCCLCDCVVNVRLSPCGHSTMCSECAGTAKRCPQCRVSSSSGTLCNSSVTTIIV